MGHRHQHQRHVPARERLPPSEVRWDPADPLLTGGLHVRFETEREPVSPVPTQRFEETPDVVIGGSSRGSDAWVSILRFQGGPRRRQTLPLLSPQVTIGGPGCTVDLGPTCRDLVAILHVERARCTIEPRTRSVPICLQDGPIHRATAISKDDTITIGPHVFVLRPERVHVPTAPGEAVGELVGDTPAMRQLYGGIRRVAPHDVPVLVVGPTATGKELVARAIHQLSPRANGPFVVVNSGQLSGPLLASELFGHEKGAFTGAIGRTDGKWRAAEGGTLVLDEFGEAAPDLQVQLLRALETGEIARVGSTHTDRPNVRVICCTNRDLLSDVDEERIRADLLQRVTALVLVTPPLAKRLADLPVLVDTLLARHHPGAQIGPAALARLQQHDWPGNVRELRQVLLRAFVHAEDGRIDAEHIRFNHELLAAIGTAAPPFVQPVSTLVPKDITQMNEEELRRERALRTPAEMAELRQISRGKVLYWLRKKGVSTPPDAGRGRPRDHRSFPPG